MPRLVSEHQESCPQSLHPGNGGQGDGRNQPMKARGGKREKKGEGATSKPAAMPGTWWAHRMVHISPALPGAMGKGAPG